MAWPAIRMDNFYGKRICGRYQDPTVQNGDGFAGMIRSNETECPEGYTGCFDQIGPVETGQIFQ